MCSSHTLYYSTCGNIYRFETSLESLARKVIALPVVDRFMGGKLGPIKATKSLLKHQIIIAFMLSGHDAGRQLACTLRRLLLGTSLTDSGGPGNQFIETTNREESLRQMATILTLESNPILQCTLVRPSFSWAMHLLNE